MTDETLHLITVTVKGLGRRSDYEFLVNELTLRRAVALRAILDIHLRDRTNEALDKWLDEAVERVQSFRSGGFTYTYTPEETPDDGLVHE